MPQLLRTLTLAAAFMVSPIAHAGTVIHNDLGGSVLRYAFAAKQLDGPAIRGMCASACTLYLSSRRYCVDRNARLIFHAASYKGNPRAARLFTRWMFSKYPPKVQRWIKRNGGLTSRLITLKGEALRQTVRICRN